VFGRLMYGLEGNVRMDFKEMVEMIWTNWGYVPVAGSCGRCNESSHSVGNFCEHTIGLSHSELWSVETFVSAAWRVTRLPAADLVKAVTCGWEFTVHSITTGKTSTCPPSWLWKAKKKVEWWFVNNWHVRCWREIVCPAFLNHASLKWENRGYLMML
jgi:hypothetical protein